MAACVWPAATERSVRQASVWLLDYPGSVIPRPDKSVLATWGEPGLWQTLETIGIDLLHTGPINLAGGVRGREHTPSLDGWFDPISLKIDPALGTQEQYRRPVRVADEHQGSVAGDLVPLHTGCCPTRLPPSWIRPVGWRSYCRP